MKKHIIIFTITILFALLNFYFTLPPLNIQSFAFWWYIISIVVIFYLANSFTNLEITFSKNGKAEYKKLEDIMQNKLYSKVNIALASLVGVVIVITLLINVLSSPLLNADKYAARINIEDANFAEDINEVDFNEVPLLDKDSIQKLGDRKMGELPDLVSQFYVSNLYTQINYNNEIVRVTPLEYNDIFKYFSNKDEGVTAYIKVDSVSGKAEIEELDKGMKYMPSAYFSEDLARKLRFKYPTLIFDTATFEIDEEGNPHWVVPVISYKGVNLRKEISHVVTLDPVTGDTKKYKVEDAPKWIDHVYPSDLILEQINNWGDYVNGFWNSIIGQKNVVNTTEGYNYLSIDGDIYLYTGITSVAADESNLGFVLVNLRTKESHYYPVAGAEEFSAMSSAEGLVQEKGYVSSFPLLINLNGRATYLMSLKDSAGLVKMYAFVDVVDYQIVSTTDAHEGIENAASDYLSKINNDSTTTGNELEKEITIKSITSGVINGTTVYYILDNENNKYQLSLTVNEEIAPFIKSGDNYKIKYTESDINIIKTIE